MKFYLGGGRNLSEVPLMKASITQILQKEHIKELLHIPFAGVGIRHKTSGRCMPKEFQLFIENLGIKYFDASYEEDIDAWSGEHIYIELQNLRKTR
ncbi:MAG: hypothetical protein LBO09_04005 [Candidatus Peribacteria bacterium]|jgi:hypothetical protein|nr:hypothetical protein [Candidatus Peribacteria bacterium]